MVGRKLALVLGILLILAVASESNEPIVDEAAETGETSGAPPALGNNAHNRKKHVSSALQTLIHRLLKTKDDGDAESGRNKGTKPKGNGRDLESRNCVF